MTPDELRRQALETLDWLFYTPTTTTIPWDQQRKEAIIDALLSLLTPFSAKLAIDQLLDRIIEAEDESEQYRNLIQWIWSQRFGGHFRAAMIAHISPELRCVLDRALGGNDAS